jgi:hypothetical protein
VRSGAFLDLILIVGGVLMVIGSFEPWTVGRVANGFVTYENGFQLNLGGGISVAGVISLAFGTHSTVTAALHLAERRRFRVLVRLPVIDGLVGTGVGLCRTGRGSLVRASVDREQSSSIQRWHGCRYLVTAVRRIGDPR